MSAPTVTMPLRGAWITSEVQKFYERHPYPAYPLLARPQWWRNPLCAPVFSARVADTYAPSRVLILGCGEILPVAIDAWQDHQGSLVGLDLSRRSLMRARVRLGISGRRAQLVSEPLESYLPRTEPASFDHIDAYGVLHHLANPLDSLSTLHRALEPGGTLRLMVYNRQARLWIRHIQRAVDLIGWSPYQARHIRQLAKLLELVGQELPAVQQKLTGMGRDFFANDARVADTFMHTREAQIPIPHWYDAIQAAGFEMISLYDRYAELDDLPNPMWQAPDADALTARARDSRFENNLELILHKPTHGPSDRSPLAPVPRGLYWRSAPQAWFSFNETRQISSVIRRRVWHKWLQHMRDEDAGQITRSLARTLGVQAMQRLARVGAILPAQCHPGIRTKLMAPMVRAMSAPTIPTAKSLADTKAERWLRSKIGEGPRLHAVIRRLEAAQGH